MKFQIKKLSIIFAIVAVSATSCFDDLDIVPIDEDYNTSEKLYRNPENYKGVLAKLYAGLAVTGQQGPAGAGDLVGKDEGFSSYLRNYWKAQELTTEEAINSWVNDIGLSDYHEMDWDANNQFVDGMYYRIYYQIPLANEFIREAADSKLEFREVPTDLAADIRIFKEEARFLRALSYWHALDMFRNAPFIPENAGTGSFQPEQGTPNELFSYIETELLDIETKLIAPKQNEYGRVDQAAAWMLLAKLYMNAEVYIGENKYAECLTYCNKIINSGAYSLQGNYVENFLADNHLSSEVIFPILFDGQYTQTWGGMTFLINGSNGGSMIPEDRGVNGAWAGNRTTGGLIEKFDTTSNSTDTRRLFFSEGQNYEINNVGTFTDGWAITKFSNITSTGQSGADVTHPDTDFPMFRLADVYLMYAECVERGAGGDAAIALGYINDIRNRATVAPVTDADVDLDFILDERARELYWEGHRRIDLIRHNKFISSSYLWPWKGGIKEGQGVDEKYKIFPIPSADLGANPKLVQNPGY
jgi:hypothetical protein